MTLGGKRTRIRRGGNLTDFHADRHQKDSRKKDCFFRTETRYSTHIALERRQASASSFTLSLNANKIVQSSKRRMSLIGRPSGKKYYRFPTRTELV